MTTLKKKKKGAYAAAGVDIDAMDIGLKKAGRLVKATRTAGAISNIGSFGGMFKSPGKDHILVSSTDGVGTKLMVASAAKRHHTVGQDLVNHCVNDILVQGAEPLFFLDYLGTAKLNPNTFVQVISGLTKACKQNGCTLIGGETAEMPGLYPPGEYDLVGTIVGSVARKKVITGGSIRAGDTLIGLPSSGLHTNGFSLARKILFEKAGLKVNQKFPGTKRTVADVLLAVHKSYLRPIQKLRKTMNVRGLAHITGGGLVDNVPRIMPAGLCAEIDRSTWRVPHVFQFMQDAGRVDRDEMFRVFNMGIGMVVFVRAADTKKAMDILKKARCAPRIIGRVTRGKKPVKLLN